VNAEQFIKINKAKKSTPTKGRADTMKLSKIAALSLLMILTGAAFTLAADSDSVKARNSNEDKGCNAPKMIFMEVTENPDRPLPVDLKTKSIFIFIKRKNELSREEFFNYLSNSFPENVYKLQDELKYTSFKEHHDASMNGLLTSPYIFARNHFYSRLLCKLYGGVTPPAKTCLPYTPYFDAGIEFQFDSTPTSAQIQAIKKLSRDLSYMSERMSFVESEKRLLGKEVSPTQSAEAVYMFEFLKRRPNVTREEAQDYWMHEHGGYIIDNVQYSQPEKYWQVHEVESSKAHFDDPYEGFAYVRIPSRFHLVKKMFDVKAWRFNNTLVVDENRFLMPVPTVLFREYDYTDKK